MHVRCQLNPIALLNFIPRHFRGLFRSFAFKVPFALMFSAASVTLSFAFSAGLVHLTPLSSPLGQNLRCFYRFSPPQDHLFLRARQCSALAFPLADLSLQLRSRKNLLSPSITGSGSLPISPGKLLLDLLNIAPVFSSPNPNIASVISALDPSIPVQRTSIEYLKHHIRFIGRALITLFYFLWRFPLSRPLFSSSTSQLPDNPALCSRLGLRSSHALRFV